MRSLLKHFEVCMFVVLFIINLWATTVHDAHGIRVPFHVKRADGKTLLSDSVQVYVSDTPQVIARKLQLHLSQHFKEMSDEERSHLGGFKEYGLDPQRWVLYQNTKMFKLFDPEQALIDNYDRLHKNYHNTPLIATYFLASGDTPAVKQFGY